MRSVAAGLALAAVVAAVAAAAPTSNIRGLARITLSSLSDRKVRSVGTSDNHEGARWSLDPER